MHVVSQQAVSYPLTISTVQEIISGRWKLCEYITIQLSRKWGRGGGGPGGSGPPVLKNWGPAPPSHLVK